MQLGFTGIRGTRNYTVNTDVAQSLGWTLNHVNSPNHLTNPAVRSWGRTVQEFSQAFSHDCLFDNNTEATQYDSWISRFDFRCFEAALFSYRLYRAHCIAADLFSLCWATMLAVSAPFRTSFGKDYILYTWSHSSLLPWQSPSFGLSMVGTDLSMDFCFGWCSTTHH